MPVVNPAALGVMCGQLLAVSSQQRWVALDCRKIGAPLPYHGQRSGGNQERGRLLRCSASGTASAAASAGAGAPQVVLTRERGKNGKLRKVLEQRGILCLEMPLVETAAGPDREQLVVELQQQGRYDWVCLTSPEAASVFLAAWHAAGKPSISIAVVGAGTGKVLTDAEGDVLEPRFVPSVANAEHFAPELPFLEGGSRRVLYPASCKASSELQQGLTARGFQVVRLNTYDTQPVGSLAVEVLEQAKQAAVVTVASPSAVKAWVQLSGGETSAAIACIGGTSARAAEKLGLTGIYYPQEPGVENWAAVVCQALSEHVAA